MPTYSVEFQALRLRLNDLAQLLPAAPAVGAAPSSRDVDQMSAFVVLAHAACEHFMETRAHKTATDAKLAFDNGGQFGRVAKHLCVFPFVEIPKQSADLNKLSKIFGAGSFGVFATSRFVTSNRMDIQRLLNVGYQKFVASVDNNHGASFKYQFKLLSMIGFDLTVLGSNFASRITQLAGYRGMAAHTEVIAANLQYSSTTLATWPIDLIEGYRKLDWKLASLTTKVK